MQSRSSSTSGLNINSGSVQLPAPPGDAFCCARFAIRRLASATATKTWEADQVTRGAVVTLRGEARRDGKVKLWLELGSLLEKKASSVSEPTHTHTHNPVCVLH